MRFKICIDEDSGKELTVVRGQGEIHVSNADLQAIDALASVEFKDIANIQFDTDLTLSSVSRIRKITGCQVTQYPTDTIARMAIEEFID